MVNLNGEESQMAKGRRATVRRNTRERESTIDDLLGGRFREKRDAFREFPNPSLHLQHIHVRDNHKTTNMSIAKAYLLAYNASLIAGWSYVLVLAGAAFAEGGAGAVYAAVEIPLLAAQTAACLEVVHAILGIARSPVLVTAMQVSSRLMVVWGVLFISPPRAPPSWRSARWAAWCSGSACRLCCCAGGSPRWCGTPSTSSSSWARSRVS